MRLFGAKVVAGDLVQLDGSDQVTVVEDASTTKATIDHVVLPMVGYDSMYPTNEVGSFCRDLLNQEKVQLTKDAPDEAKIKGNSYRRLVARADNLLYEILPPVDESDDSVHAKFCFDLPTGTYATMFFRELLCTTVARDTQLAEEE